MTRLVRKTVNKINVEKLPCIENIDARRVVGRNYFENPYSNILISAKKRSGKTTVIHQATLNIISKDTKVLIFCSTVFKDPIYLDLVKKLQKRGNYVFANESFIDDNGVNLLQDLLVILQTKAREEQEEIERKKLERKEKQKKKTRESLPVMLQSNRQINLFSPGEDKRDEEEVVKVVKRKKKIAPEYLLIFDDLSGNLRHPIIETLCKKNRHFKMTIFLSSQWIHDFTPSCIKQVDSALIFRSFSEDKLELLHKHLDLSIDLKDFICLYIYATEQPFTFFNINVRDETYKKNFSEQISIT